MTRSVKRFLGLGAATAVLSVGSLFFVQPFLPSKAYAVKVSIDGKPLRPELYRLPLESDIFYLRLPGEIPHRNRWFGISFSQAVVFLPISVRDGWGGFCYIHHDQAGGVPLRNGKIEEDWEVLFTARGVEFSNGSLVVNLSKN